MICRVIREIDVSATVAATRGSIGGVSMLFASLPRGCLASLPSLTQPLPRCQMGAAVKWFWDGSIIPVKTRSKALGLIPIKIQTERHLGQQGQDRHREVSEDGASRGARRERSLFP